MLAHFLATGSGIGGAQTANAPKLTIAQIGAGYDSLIPTNNYVEDQCMEACTGPSEIGQDVTLANAGPNPSTNYQQLVNVVVALRNWGGAITNLPISLYLSQTVNGPTTVPVTIASIPAADGANQPRPTSCSTSAPTTSSSQVSSSTGSPSRRGGRQPTASLNIALKLGGQPGRRDRHLGCRKPLDRRPVRSEQRLPDL